MEPIRPLRAHRQNRGWSHLAERLVLLGDEVGEHGLGATGAMVGRWERAERRPRPPYPKLLCLLFEASASELGIAGSPQPPSCGRLDDVERRTLLRLLAGALAAPVLVRGEAGANRLGGEKAEADRLAHALRRPSGSDEAVASAVEAAIGSARRLDDVSGSRVAVRPALAQREVIQTLLEGGPPETVKARLTVAAAELSQLLGWLAYDMNDHRTSRRYLDEALQIAHETGAQSLGAYVLGHRSQVEVHGGRPHEGLAFAEAANGRAEAKGSPRTRSWLAIIEAEALGRLRDRMGAERALDRARTTFAQSKAEDEPSWMYYYDGAELERGMGSVYLDLGLAEPTRRAMQQSLATSDASIVRDRAFDLARLGQTYVLDGEVGEACRLGGEALKIATATRCDRAILRVRKLRAQLKPWESEAMVRDLDDQLAATSAWFQPVAI